MRYQKTFKLRQKELRRKKSANNLQIRHVFQGKLEILKLISEILPTRSDFSQFLIVNRSFFFSNGFFSVEF